jgi:hypothetical protein
MQTDKTTQNIEQSNQPQRINTLRWITLLNFVLLFIVCRETGIIRSDGPSGFGEMLFKSLVLLLTPIFFFASVLSSFTAPANEQLSLFLRIVHTFTTLWLVFFPSLQYSMRALMGEAIVATGVYSSLGDCCSH